MKTKNIVWTVAVALILVAVVTVISWAVVESSPEILQGTVEATTYRASSRVPGRIEQMLVRQGQHVEKGELLYVLSIPELEAKLRQAEAARSAASAKDRQALAGARTEQIEAAFSMWKKAEAGLALAQKTYDRVKTLHDEGVLPAQKLDEATASLESVKAASQAARAQYEMAKAGARNEDKQAAAALVAQAEGAVSEVESYIQDACVYAPASGEVSAVISQAGELVGSGYPVVSILDMTDQWVTFNIREDMLPGITMGKRFTAFVPALDSRIELEVDYISPQADFAVWAATRTRGGFDVRTFEVKARPVQMPSALRPGMSVLAEWERIR